MGTYEICSVVFAPAIFVTLSGASVVFAFLSKSWIVPGISLSLLTLSFLTVLFNLVLSKGINPLNLLGPLDQNLLSFFLAFGLSAVATVLFVFLGIALLGLRRRQVVSVRTEVFGAFIVFVCAVSFSPPFTSVAACLAMAVLAKSRWGTVIAGPLFVIACIPELSPALHRADPHAIVLWLDLGGIGLSLLTVVLQAAHYFQSSNSTGVSLAALEPQFSPDQKIGISHSESTVKSYSQLAAIRMFVALGALISIVAVLLESNLFLINPLSMNRVLVRGLCASFAVPVFYVGTIALGVTSKERPPLLKKGSVYWGMVYCIWSLWDIFLH